MDKKKSVKILERLEKAIPNPKVALNYSNAFELLIATILSAQCTDERVNQVTKSLFRKYRKPEDYVKADLRQLEEEIRPTGFFRNKAKLIQGCCARIVKDFGGKVPRTVEELTTLPGVGRKTANIVLGNAYGQQAIAVDTHVRPVAQRIGLAKSDDPDQIEQELGELLPQQRWTLATNLLIWHGRMTCTARNPKCLECVLYDLCEWPEKP